MSSVWSDSLFCFFHFHNGALIAKILKNELGVKESYEPAPKRVTPGELIETNGAVLKWYACTFESDPLTPNVEV
jgi:hypothetical protein